MEGLRPLKGGWKRTTLAWELAFVAGAVNAGGFLALGYYTSHITGSLSRFVDNSVLGEGSVALHALSLVVSFFAGAFTAGMLINYGERGRFRGHYALSLFAQSILLAGFGYFGGRTDLMGGSYLAITGLGLSFIMGMLNATVTAVSKAEIRATHMTGVVTDLALEVSQLLYVNRSRSKKIAPVIADRRRLKLHALILSWFVVGGFAGALGFKQFGFQASFVLSLMMLALALRPLGHDYRARTRLIRAKKN